MNAFIFYSKVVIFTSAAYFGVILCFCTIARSMA